MCIAQMAWTGMTGGKRHRMKSNELNSTTEPDQPTVYQIRVKGYLGSQWAGWFEGLTITQDEGGDTLITGFVVDQAALHGLLRKVRDLGMPLVSVNPVKSDHADLSNAKS